MSQKKFYVILSTILAATILTLVALFFIRKSFFAKETKITNVYSTFIESFEDFERPKQKSSFGFGSMHSLSSAVEELANYMNICRQYKIGYLEDYRFEVKVEPKNQNFRVVGILTGASENPEASQCLRDKINTVKFPSLKTLNEVLEDKYRLVIAVKEARAAESLSE